MNEQDQLRSARLWIAVLGLDLQLYKGSIYKLRWGTPGGIDQALPCYDEAISILDETDWPEGLGASARDLRERVVAYRATLAAKDVTTASAQGSRMMSAFEALRRGVRAWPDGGEGMTVGAMAGGASAVPAGGASGAAMGQRDSMDEVVSSA